MHKIAIVASFTAATKPIAAINRSDPSCLTDGLALLFLELLSITNLSLVLQMAIESGDQL